MASKGDWSVIRILMVEDEEASANLLIAKLSSLPINPTIRLARSRESALQAIDEAPYDLVICDLALPPRDGGLDVAEEHGWFVLAAIRERSPGTPVTVLSGYADLPKLRESIGAGSPDTFADGSHVQLTNGFTKDELERFADSVNGLASRLEQLSLIPIASTMIVLTRWEARVVADLVSQKKCASAAIEQVYNGLSGARTVRLNVFDRAGKSQAILVAKLAPLSQLSNEVQRYDQYVSQMPPQSIAQRAGEVLAGCGWDGGLFYALGEAFDRSLYQLLREEPAAAADVVNKLLLMQRRWADAADERSTNIRNVRRSRVSDDNMATASQLLAGLDWQQLEDLPLRLPYLTQHRDLHAGNVLVDHSSGAILIDYGDVGPGPGGLDPITLEMSVALQESGRPARGGWPAASASQWPDVDQYVQGCPFPDFVRACRTWARSAAGSDAALWAVGYTYAVRQLLYPDPDKEGARRMIEAIIEAWRAVRPVDDGP